MPVVRDMKPSSSGKKLNSNWSIGVSIPVPRACKARTLPIELMPRQVCSACLQSLDKMLHNRIKKISKLKTSQMGLEPTIFGSGNRRLIHLATGTLAPPVGLEPTISPLGGVRLIH